MFVLTFQTRHQLLLQKLNMLMSATHCWLCYSLHMLDACIMLQDDESQHAVLSMICSAAHITRSRCMQG